MNHPDIVPYSPEDAKAMAQLLFSMGVKSMGPGVAVKMLEIAEAISVVVKDAPQLQDGTGWPLTGYALRLRDVAMVQGELAGLVIDELTRLTEKKE